MLMKPFKFALFGVLMSFFPLNANTQVLGKWTTIDDETGKPRSIVEIFERGGNLFGRILTIYPEPGKSPDPICTACDPADPRYKTKVKGMEIIRNMKKDGSEYAGGDILDPKSGKVYRCKLWVEGKELKVRGYLGPFFRTQTWKYAD